MIITILILKNFSIGEIYINSYKMNDNKKSDNSKDETVTINDCMLRYRHF